MSSIFTGERVWGVSSTGGNVRWRGGGTKGEWAECTDLFYVNFLLTNKNSHHLKTSFGSETQPLSLLMDAELLWCFDCRRKLAFSSFLFKLDVAALANFSWPEGCFGQEIAKWGIWKEAFTKGVALFLHLYEWNAHGATVHTEYM